MSTARKVLGNTAVQVAGTFVMAFMMFSLYSEGFGLRELCALFPKSQPLYRF